MHLLKILPIATLFLGLTAVTANAQGQPYVFDEAYVDPDRGFQPLLGFTGQIDNRGMKVIRTHRGSLARRIGLESGDVITHVNGVRIYSHQQYLRLLRLATIDRGGRVALRIENVRWWTGEAVNRYVYRTARFSAPREYSLEFVPASGF